MKEGAILNATAIKNAFTERELRQWWVAEQLKVDRKTVARWVSGKVRRTDRQTASQLALVRPIHRRANRLWPLIIGVRQKIFTLIATLIFAQMKCSAFWIPLSSECDLNEVLIECM